jgi:hypothetical protein
MKKEHSDRSLRVNENGELWLDARLTSEWRASYRLAIQGGRVVVAELRIFPAPQPLSDLGPGSHSLAHVLTQQSTELPAGGLSTRLVRAVRVGNDVRSLAEIIDFVRVKYPAALAPDGILGRAGITAKTLTTPPPPRAPADAKRGRPQKPALMYAQLASEYADLVAGGSDKPVEELATRWGEQVTCIRSRLQTARRLKFLEPGTRGNAGGILLPAAKQLLKKGTRHGRTTRTR